MEKVTHVFRGAIGDTEVIIKKIPYQTLLTQTAQKIARKEASPSSYDIAQAQRKISLPPIEPEILALYPDYYLGHYIERRENRAADLMCYIYRYYGEDMYALRDEIDRAYPEKRSERNQIGNPHRELTAELVIRFHLWTISMLLNLARFHAIGCTHGDIKLENWVVQNDKARLIDLESAGRAGRPLSTFTIGYLRVLRQRDPAFLIATKRNDIHALMVSILALISINHTYKKIGQISRYTQKPSRYNMKCARAISRSYFTDFDPDIPVSCHIFLNCVHRLNTKQIDLRFCAEIIQANLSKIRGLSRPRPMPAHEHKEAETEAELPIAAITRAQYYGATTPAFEVSRGATTTIKTEKKPEKKSCCSDCCCCRCRCSIA